MTHNENRRYFYFQNYYLLLQLKIDRIEGNITADDRTNHYFRRY